MQYNTSVHSSDISAAHNYTYELPYKAVIYIYLYPSFGCCTMKNITVENYADSSNTEFNMVALHLLPKIYILLCNRQCTQQNRPLIVSISSYSKNIVIKFIIEVLTVAGRLF